MICHWHLYYNQWNWNILRTCIPRWLRRNWGRVIHNSWTSGYSFGYVNFRSMFYAGINSVSRRCSQGLPNSEVDGKLQSIPCFLLHPPPRIWRWTVSRLYWNFQCLGQKHVSAILQGFIKTCFMSDSLKFTWIICSYPIPSCINFWGRRASVWGRKIERTIKADGGIFDNVMNRGLTKLLKYKSSYSARLTVSRVLEKTQFLCCFCLAIVRVQNHTYKHDGV